MLETKVIPHLIDRGIYLPVFYHEVVYNAAEPDDDDGEDTWLSCHSSDPKLWLSYGFYEDSIVAQYIADGIKCGKIKVKTFK